MNSNILSHLMVDEYTASKEGESMSNQPQPTAQDIERQLQRDCDTFVSQNVYIQQDSIVNALLEHGIVTYDDIVNFYQKKEIADLLHDYRDELIDIVENNFCDEFLMFLGDELGNDDAYTTAYNDDTLNFVDIATEQSDLFYAFVIALDDDDMETLYDELEDDAIDYGSEIYTWYLVNDYMARKLEAKGETILEFSGSTWWGRRTYGQLIAMDGVIREIVRDINAS